MCGICGIHATAGRLVDRATLEGMTRSMSHRGPDGAGLFVSDPVGFGHRRLSIIDLKDGSQPMSTRAGALQLVFNGEIYNYVELRENLKQIGHRFRTASDTEVILHAYEEWGTDCIRRFNGIFAFALYDIEAGHLFLARDHLGVKPLYHTRTDNGDFLFASEIKALLRHPDVRREVDHLALADLFTYRYVPSPRTLFRRIEKIPPGHYMVVDRTGTRSARFWDHVPQPVNGAREKELVKSYQDILEDAVRIQLRSDVPVGLFLSSGIDSGALMALMSQHAGEPVHTFTIGFEGGSRTNELDGARDLSKRFGSRHHERLIGPGDYMSYYRRYMLDIEEPVGNETAAAFYFVSHLAKDHVKVVLSGQGADEPWGGYHRHLGAKLSEWYSFLPSTVADSLARVITRYIPRNERLKRGVLSLAEKDIRLRLRKIYSFFSQDMKREMFQDWLWEETGRTMETLNESLTGILRDLEGRDLLTQILYLDTRTNLPDDLLMVGDKTSMANSIEMRVPYLDVRLVELVESMPSHMKIRGLSGKYLHKKALAKWLPAYIIRRKKKGFENPIHEWFRSGMAGFIEETLLSGDSSASRYFRKEYIRRLYELHKSRREHNFRQLYLLLSFEMWHMAFL
jgi:asparagine synthase (glutamine-hydrolysing)